MLLQVVDMRWREHLWHLDHLRSVIHLRGYAQRDPLNEFKTEAFTLFETLLIDLRRAVTRMLMRGQFVAEQPPRTMPAMRAAARRQRTARAGADAGCAAQPRQAAQAGRSGLGQHAAQRALPVRIGQALQELPRRRDRGGAGLGRNAPPEPRLHLVLGRPGDPELTLLEFSFMGCCDPGVGPHPALAGRSRGEGRGQLRLQVSRLAPSVEILMPRLPLLILPFALRGAGHGAEPRTA